MGDGAPRYRHDGWTPERRLRFCAELARTGCVKDAAQAVGLTTTSAYRAYKRDAAFAQQWDEALESERPILMQAAFERAVNGVEVPIRRNGKVVATKRRYSDGLLQFLIERDDRRRAAQPWRRPKSLDELSEGILAKFEAIEAHRQDREEAEALAFAERMRAEGWAP